MTAKICYVRECICLDIVCDELETARTRNCSNFTFSKMSSLSPASPLELQLFDDSGAFAVFQVYDPSVIETAIQVAAHKNDLLLVNRADWWTGAGEILMTKLQLQSHPGI